LAWCAGDKQALEVFASGRDPYKVMATKIFGVNYDAVSKPQRHLGKIAELSLGYGCGAQKFEWTAARQGVDLRAAGINAEQVVRAWREQHAPIVRFWYAMQDAFFAAANGLDSRDRADGFEFTSSDDGKDVALWLPSGRPIIYNDVRIGSDDRGRPRLAFTGTRGAEHTWGGKIVENAIQALCRDLLADALVNAERAGLCPVLHIHDSQICEIPIASEKEGSSLLNKTMSSRPDWARGFPLEAVGHSGVRYR
jgi:DNA polymerase